MTVRRITVGAVKTTTGLNIMITNDNSFDLNTNINITSDANYVLAEKAIITADSYESDNYVDKNEISYTKTTANGELTNYTIPARSVVVLSLTEIPESTALEVLSATAESVSYKLSVASADAGEATIICAVYNGDTFVSAVSEPITLAAGIVEKSMTVDASEGNEVRLMLFDSLESMEPVCQKDVFRK